MDRGKALGYLLNLFCAVSPESQGYKPEAERRSIDAASTSSSSDRFTPSSDEDTAELSTSGLQPHLCFTLMKNAVVKHLHTHPHPSKKLQAINVQQQKVNSFHSATNCSASSPKSGWRCFTYQEIAAATKYFDANCLVGQGGYAKVYKGSLLGGKHIAVKKLTRGDTEGMDFLTELGILGHVSHPNAVALLGFCVEFGHYLVFECFPRGSLATYLHDSRNTTLEWPHRYKVALGTARGLHYLHKQCQRRIIHRDVKSSNILLGADFEPQISDFGLAKWLPQQWTHHTVAPLEGTIGYLAPEYVMHGIVDEKTDVYAFGIVLLELITGHRPVESSQQDLVVRVKPLLESGNIEELADSRLRGVYNLNEMQRLVVAAALCVRDSSISRPSMGQVLQLLTDDKLDVGTIFGERMPYSSYTRKKR